MMWLGEQLLAYGKLVPAAEIKQRLCDVKGAEVRTVARALFGPERMSLAVVSPIKGERSLARMLKL
jgi:predicted Zn-dependent peptidase